MTIKATRTNTIARWAPQAAVWAAIFFALYWVGTRNYLLFHIATELFSVVIAFTLFGLSWNVRDNLDNQSVLLIGITYAFVALIDTAHALAYKGMGVFPFDEANHATQLWLAARYLQTAALLAAPAFTRRKLPVVPTLLITAGITIFLLLSIFVFDIFPNAFIEGQGLTPFKIYSEYVISALLTVSLFLLYRRREAFDPVVRYWLALSICATILSELAFTTYASVYDGINMLGHFLKIIAFFLVYKAVVEIGLRRPFELLFRNFKASADALQNERDFIAAMLNTGHALVVVFDSNGVIARVNHAVEATTGYPASELVGRYIGDTPLASEIPEAEREQIRASLHLPEPVSYEARLKARDGSVRYITWTDATLPEKPGQPLYVISTGIDVTDRRRAEEDLRRMATHDALTGLYNRAYFEDELLRLTRSDRFPVSIIITDVDGLKAVNDTQGHAAGDRLLREVAKVLQMAFRVEDVVARIGGDEFGVLLPGADAVDAQQAQNRLRAVEAEFNRANQEFTVSISSGWATAQSGALLDESMRQADRAMYLEKLSRSNARKQED